MFYSEGDGSVECSTHEEAVARANAIRAKLGKPPLSDKPPGGAVVAPSAAVPPPPVELPMKPSVKGGK